MKIIDCCESNKQIGHACTLRINQHGRPSNPMEELSAPREGIDKRRKMSGRQRKAKKRLWVKNAHPKPIVCLPQMKKQRQPGQSPEPVEAPTGLRSQGGVMVAWQSSLEMNEEQQQNEEQKMNEKQQPTSQKPHWRSSQAKYQR